jgi:hypothetical protein
MSAVATAYDELIEALGTGVIGSGDNAAGELNDLASAMYDAQPVAEDIGQVIHDVAMGLSDTLTYLGPVVDKFNELNQMGDGILTDGTLATLAKIVIGGRYLTGVVTGNEAARAEAWRDFNNGNVQNGGDFSTPVTYFGSGDLYTTPDPTRQAQRNRDADARAAARGAKTRAR